MTFMPYLHEVPHNSQYCHIVTLWDLKWLSDTRVTQWLVTFPISLTARVGVHVVAFCIFV